MPGALEFTRAVILSQPICRTEHRASQSGCAHPRRSPVSWGRCGRTTDISPEGPSTIKRVSPCSPPPGAWEGPPECVLKLELPGTAGLGLAAWDLRAWGCALRNGTAGRQCVDFRCTDAAVFHSIHTPLPTPPPRSPPHPSLPFPSSSQRLILSHQPAPCASERFLHETNYALLIWKLAAFPLTFI